MTQQRGPHYSKKCPFHIIPNQPLTAEKSVTRCVKCVSCSDQRLQQMSADLHQIARLAIAENSPKYDPEHKSGASFRTFIRSKVCSTLWNESAKLLQWIPCPTVEEAQEPQQFAANPLVDRLTTEACQCESVDETVAFDVDLEKFKTLLPQLLSRLSEKEGTVLKMKFFEELKAVEIAKRLGISKGRVSQLSRSALTKLEKAYLSGATQS